MCSTTGLSLIGISGFGKTFVKGFILVPSPPAIITTGTSSLKFLTSFIFFSEYFNFIYFGWSGRFLQTLLSYLVFKYDFFLLAIKILNIPVFFTCILIGWYCVTGEKKIILQNCYEI